MLRRYAQWAGNPDGIKEDTTLCISEVYDMETFRHHQCTRKRGHGPNGEYCTQHAKIANRRLGTKS